MTFVPQRQLRFYMTSVAPCPYLPGQTERKVFANLPFSEGVHVNDELTQAGFRRSQNIAYRPACLRCNACRSVRVPVRDFELSRNDRKVLAKNENLVRRPVVSQATREQFRLLKSYVKTRHDNGGMSEMTYRDYVAMVGGSPVQSLIFEYRDGPEDTAPLPDLSLAEVVERLSALTRATAPRELPGLLDRLDAAPNTLPASSDAVACHNTPPLAALTAMIWLSWVIT